jgi:glycosyltransferase involved in cell wall biosynthesis
VPSIWNERFGLVVAEGMSNGAAIITSKVEGIPEIIRKNGIVIENIDDNKLVYELKKLIEDKTKRKNF